MKLHAVDREFAVPQPHDFTFVGVAQISRHAGSDSRFTIKEW